MADGRKKNGGKRPNAGRKGKAEELGLVGLLDKCWTPSDREDCITKLAEKARAGDMDATKLLLAYTYGKPVDRKELTGKDGEPLRIVTAQELTDDELAAIALGH